MEEVKKCRNLRYDKVNDDYWCGSTHVCYKTICFKDMFLEVKHGFGYTETIRY